MKHTRLVYQGVEVFSREVDVIEFLHTGSHNFWDAYSYYHDRKKRMDRPTLTIATWFNHAIKTLHEKGLMQHIPFVLHAGKDQFIWRNPGVKGSKANFVALTLQEDKMELANEINKIL